MRYLLLIPAAIVLELAFDGEHTLGYYAALAVVFLLVNRKRGSKGPTSLSLSVNQKGPSDSIPKEARTIDDQTGLSNRAAVPDQETVVMDAPPEPSPASPRLEAAIGNEQNRDEPPSRGSHKKGWIWVFGVGLAASVVFIVLYSVITSPPTARPFTPTVAVWDRDACRERTFGKLTIEEGDNVNLRKQQEVWFCSHQWDEPFIAKSADVLEANGMLPVQWYPGHDYDRGFYGAIPKPASDFAKVFDGGRLLLSTDTEFDSQRPDFPSLPSLRAFRAVKSALPPTTNATLQKPLPQVYAVNLQNPSIHLVTDLGTQLSFGQTLQLVQSGLEGTLFEGMNKAEQMGVHLEGYGTWMNPDAFAVSMMQQLMLHVAAAERTQRGMKALPDVEVLYLSDDIPDSSGALTHREGYYDPRRSRIYVHMTGNVPVPPKPSHQEISNLVARVLPAPLEHEYFHYLFYRPEIGSSGFILEGEATANGERLHQEIIAGTVLTHDTGDRLRQLVDKLESDPTSLTSAEWQEYEKLEDDYLSHQPLTEVQCSSLGSVYRHHVVRAEPFDLRSLLSMDLVKFNQSDPVLNYAEAWAVYHVDLIEKKQWGKDLDRIYAGLASGAQLNSADSALVERIARETLQWVKARAETKDSSCEP